jgi:hypothetical protein
MVWFIDFVARNENTVVEINFLGKLFQLFLGATILSNCLARSSFVEAM